MVERVTKLDGFLSVECDFGKQIDKTDAVGSLVRSQESISFTLTCPQCIAEY